MPKTHLTSQSYLSPSYNLGYRGYFTMMITHTPICLPARSPMRAHYTCIVHGKPSAIKSLLCDMIPKVGDRMVGRGDL